MKLITIAFFILLFSTMIVGVQCVTYQPQVANFEIVEFGDFGTITDQKAVNITIRCVEGSGSGTVTLTKEGKVSLSITPEFGIPSLSVGETYTTTIIVQNLGNPANIAFTIIATVSNSIGSVTDNATSSGTALKKTGEATYLNVETLHRGLPVDNLEITITYFDYSQIEKTRTFHGQGTARFDLETSADVKDIEVVFEGNDVYYPVLTNVDVKGGTEETVILNLDRIGESNEEGRNWELVAVVLGLCTIATSLSVAYIMKKK